MPRGWGRVQHATEHAVLTICHGVDLMNKRHCLTFTPLQFSGWNDSWGLFNSCTRVKFR